MQSGVQSALYCLSLLFIASVYKVQFSSYV